MKKTFCIIILAIMFMLAFAGCAEVYRVPKDRCIVSVPQGFELWTDDAETLQKIDIPIKNVEREADRIYYSVTRGATFSVVNFDNYAYDEGSKSEGNILTGFDISGNVLPFNPSSEYKIELSCNENTDIQPVYERFQAVGMVAFVGDDNESLWDKVWNIDKFFNADGTPKQEENFYYLIQYTKQNLPKHYWQTNFDCTDISNTSVSTTYTVKRVAVSGNQDLAYCVLNRYDETKYFVPSPIYGDNLSAPMVSITIDIGKDYKLTVAFED